MSVPQRFGILRLIGTLLKVVAWIVLVCSILLAMFAGLAGPLARQFLGDAGLQPDLLALGSAGGLIAGVFLMVTGVVAFLSFYAAGENIFLQLAIEENTRMAAALLLRAAENDGPSTGTGTGTGLHLFVQPIMGKSWINAGEEPHRVAAPLAIPA